MRGTTVLVVMLVAGGCRYDAAALGSSHGPTDDTATTASSAGASSSTTGTTGGLDTAATFNVPTTGDATTDASTGQTSTTGPEVPMLIDDGLLARWYLDEASEGQGPRAALDHHPPPATLELYYGADSPTWAVVDGSRGLRWLEAERGGRAQVPLAGTKLESELIAAPQATFELVLSVTGVTGMGSRFLHVGVDMVPEDLAIGSSDLTEIELRWTGNVMRKFAASLTGARQILHVVVDTTQDDPLQRLRAYLDGEELVPIDAGAPAQGEGLPLLPESALVLGNRSGGSRTFRGTLQYAAIYTLPFGPAEVEHNLPLLKASDDAP